MSKRMWIIVWIGLILFVYVSYNQTQIVRTVGVVTTRQPPQPQRSMVDVVAVIPTNFHIGNTTTTTTSNDTIRTPRIAILSSYLPGAQSSKKTSFTEFDHLINKACYAKLWGYDFIFNTTYGFDKVKDEVQKNAYWLNYGTWHRVPHIRDRINDYDWILYTDVDYIFHNLKIPLESFLKNWELHGLSPSVFIPKDFDDKYYTFSAFVVFIKNDPFGRRVLDHWMDFGRGICPNGNFGRIVINLDCGMH
jgi:hypothetical protein